MRQLKMFRDSALPAGKLLLPEGYTFSCYRGSEDIPAWCECCRNGRLIEDDNAEEGFQINIIERAGIRLERDIFFLDTKGEHIATVTAFLRPDGRGGVHMIAIREDHRGRGLCAPLLKKAILHLQELGAKTFVLTTDDWRKSAIKAYLKEGFLPVEFDTGMQERWETVLEELDIDSTEMLYEDASPFRTIYRKSIAQGITDR